MLPSILINIKRPRRVRHQQLLRRTSQRLAFNVLVISVVNIRRRHLGHLLRVLRMNLNILSKTQTPFRPLLQDHHPGMPLLTPNIIRLRHRDRHLVAYRKRRMCLQSTSIQLPTPSINNFHMHRSRDHQRISLSWTVEDLEGYWMVHQDALMGIATMKKRRRTRPGR